MLSQDYGVGIGFLNGIPESSPEIMIKALAVAEIRCNIKPPTVAIIRRTNPFLTYIVNVITKLTRSLIVKLRKRIMTPPAVVFLIIGPLSVRIEVKEAVIGAVLVDISALFISGMILVNAFPVHPFIK